MALPAPAEGVQKEGARRLAAPDRVPMLDERPVCSLARVIVLSRRAEIGIGDYAEKLRILTCFRLRAPYPDNALEEDHDQPLQTPA